MALTLQIPPRPSGLNDSAHMQRRAPGMSRADFHTPAASNAMAGQEGLRPVFTGAGKRAARSCELSDSYRVGVRTQGITGEDPNQGNQNPSRTGAARPFEPLPAHFGGGFFKRIFGACAKPAVLHETPPAPIGLEVFGSPFAPAPTGPGSSKAKVRPITESTPATKAHTQNLSDKSTAHGPAPPAKAVAVSGSVFQFSSDYLTALHM